MVNQISEIAKYRLLCQSENGCLFYHKGSLFLSKIPEEKPKKGLVLPGSFSKKILSRFRLTERMLRLEPRFAVPYAEGFALSWNGGLYYVDAFLENIRCLSHYRAGMNNPLGITRIEGVQGFTDGYVYGDYWGNTQKEAVHIYRIEENGPVCVYTFAAGLVQHIHGITADSKTGRVLICTGDSNEESGIWEAFDDFKTVKLVAGGSQQCRTCAAYPVENGLLYATDTPLEANGIYFYANEHQKPEKIYSMPGPCIYSTRISGQGSHEQFVFATSVEPDSSLSPFRYKFTYHLGAGVKERYVHIVMGNLQEGFHTAVRMKKDIWPMLLFQFGNASFPFQKNSNKIYLTPTATKYTDEKTFLLSSREQ